MARFRAGSAVALGVSVAMLLAACGGGNSEGVLNAFSIDGKVYGMPTAVLPGGIYYSQDLFDEAGISEPPTTLEDVNAAVSALKDAGVAPIALGGKDAWPAAHWYYFFALRMCSQ